MKCINFDERFADFTAKWMKEHRGEYKTYDEMEDDLPRVYTEFLNTPAKWLDGVTPGALEQAKVYLRIVLFSHVFSHLAYGLSATMRSEGAVVPSMMCMVVGFGMNLVLDPIFIFGCGMGVAGAAWATWASATGISASCPK